MENTQIVRGYLEALNQHDVKKALLAFSPSAEYKMIGSTEGPVQGHAELQELFSGWMTAFPDMKGQVTNLFGSGDQVVCEYVLSGTHKGVMKTDKMGDIQPTNKRFQVPGCEVYKIAGGKIVSVSSYFDSMSFLQQLGLIQEPRAAA